MPVESVFRGIKVLDVTRILASPFASGQLSRSENGAELRKQLEKAFMTRTAAEWKRS